MSEGPEHVAVGTLAIARAIAGAVAEVPGVARLSAGRFAMVGTYGPGDFVRGVVIEPFADSFAVEIHLVASEPVEHSLLDVADAVRRAARSAITPLGVGSPGTIDVAIDDLDGPAVGDEEGST